MCRVVGYLLILAGVGLAGTLLLVGSDADPAAPGSEVLGLRTGGAAHVAAPNPVTPITITISAAVAPQPSPATPVVVTLAPRSEPQAAVRSGSDSAALARDLQGELRRVGCYGGQLNGVWTPASRKAMKAFTDRVNAALPVDAPDAILLSLVKAHQGEVCGKSCPSLETLAEDGRCVPTAVLAHLIRMGALSREPLSAKGRDVAARPAPVISGWTTSVSTPPHPAVIPPPQGRMALAGPRPEATRPVAAGKAELGPWRAREAKAKVQRVAKARSRHRRYVQRTGPRRSHAVQRFARIFWW